MERLELPEKKNEQVDDFMLLSAGLGTQKCGEQLSPVSPCDKSERECGILKQCIPLSRPNLCGP